MSRRDTASTTTTSGDSLQTDGRRLSEVFAENIFSLNTFKDRVSDSTYERMKGVF